MVYFLRNKPTRRLISKGDKPVVTNKQSLFVVKLISNKSFIQIDEGGGVHILPGIKQSTSLKEYNEMYDTFLVTGHGMTTHGTFTVPKNVYILHLIHVSSPCQSGLDQQIFYETANDGYGSYSTYFMDFIKGTKSSVFSKMYNPFQNKPQNRMNEKTSIYEPGDKVSNLEIQFINHGFFGGIGVFPVPVSDLIHNEIKRKDQIIQDLKAQGKSIDAKLEEFDVEFVTKQPILSQMIQKNKGNRTFSLEQVVSSIAQHTKNKPTFIIVEACRGVYKPRLEKQNAFEKRVKLIRQGSFAVRKFYKKGKINKTSDPDHGKDVFIFSGEKNKIKVRVANTCTIKTLDIDDITLDPSEVVFPPLPDNVQVGTPVFVYGLKTENYSYTTGKVADSTGKNIPPDRIYIHFDCTNDVKHINKNNVTLLSSVEEKLLNNAFNETFPNNKQKAVFAGKLSGNGGGKRSRRNKKLKHKVTRKQSKSKNEFN